MNSKMETRYCKKCHCELTSTSKHNTCDNCRRERNEKIRNGVIATVGTVVSAGFLLITNGKIGGNKS